jgi:type II restriction/modification system DNA methylase subunit YeeA
MGGKGMNAELGDFVKNRYPDSKSDLFAVFMERTLELTKQNGFMSMINQHSWMFLSSYEKLREKIIKNHKIDTMVHLGARAFEEIGGEVVQSVAFVLEKNKK